MSGPNAGTVHKVARQQLLNLQRKNIALINQFLAHTELYAAAAETHTATALTIDLNIPRYPTAPRFASPLMDRLLVGDEALLQALDKERL